MTEQKPRVVVGIGELLWDLLPSGKQLGGAPANFAYMTNMLGDRGIVASRLGFDELGNQAAKFFAKSGLVTDYLQYDSRHPTGTVEVQIDSAGQPQYRISTAAAWDYLEWTPGLCELAKQADAICFGTLCQRGAASRETIRKALGAVPGNALRIFDANLRQSFFSKEVLDESLRIASIVKLNSEELVCISGMFAMPGSSDQMRARYLLDRYKLDLVCVTRGDRGSLLVSDTVIASHDGYKANVADTVGAGDAFTASLVHHYMRGATLPEINDHANRLASWVSTQVGATPRAPTGSGGF